MAIPLISVLMPVYNCRDVVAESVDCVLHQSVGDFELIIVDDGSRDGTLDVVQNLALRDRRIRVVWQENKGVGAALNHALDLAQGKFFARMDGDDLTPPERFAEQLAYLEAHPDVTVLGGWHRSFGLPGQEAVGSGKTFEFPTDPGHLKAVLLFRNAISHPTVMMRGDAFGQHGWRYSTLRRYPEDYELWVTILEKHRIVNLPRIYLEYRIWPGSVCQQQPKWEEQVVEQQCRLLARIGLVPTAAERAIHGALAFDRIGDDESFLLSAHEWLKQILGHNDRAAYFDRGGLNRVLTGRYIALVKMAARMGPRVYGQLMGSPFKEHVAIPLPTPSA